MQSQAFVFYLSTLHKLPQKALTKTFWYPIIKQIGKAIGIKVTKTTVSQGISKSIPVIGGVISGALNFASMMPMANRLSEVLDKAAFNYTDEEMEADIMEIENISDEIDVSEKEPNINYHEISNTLSQGIKNAGVGLSNLFNISNKPNKEDNLEKIKKLKELLDIGAITQGEFEQKKNKLLDL